MKVRGPESTKVRGPEREPADKALPCMLPTQFGPWHSIWSLELCPECTVRSESWPLPGAIPLPQNYTRIISEK